MVAKGRHGFTLIELLVVAVFIFVMGTAIARIFVPGISKYSSKAGCKMVCE